jgi:hypothetical protein
VQGHLREIAHPRRSILIEDLIPVFSVVLVERCGVKLKQPILTVAQNIMGKVEPDLSQDHEMAVEVNKIER